MFPLLVPYLYPSCNRHPFLSFLLPILTFPTIPTIPTIIISSLPMDSFQNLDGNLTSSSSSSQQGHGDRYQELLSFPGSAVPPNGQGGIEVAGTQEWTRDGSSRTLW